MPDPTIADLAARVGRIESHLGLGTPPTDAAPAPAPAPAAGVPARPTRPRPLATAEGLRLDVDPDPAAQRWQWADDLEPEEAKRVKEETTVPWTVRSAMRAGSRPRRYRVRAGNAAARAGAPAGWSDWSDPLDVPTATAPGAPAPSTRPAPSGAPSSPSALLRGSWYLTLPTGQPGAPDTVRRPQLDTYSSKYFELTPARDGVIFRAWHGGVTTKNSPNPRSELRECNADGSLAWWPLRRGRHAMTVVGQVNRLTRVRPHVVLHQIHGRGDDVTVWRLEGTKLWITDGDNAHAHCVTDQLPLGAGYELTTEVADGRIRYLFNGARVPFELAAPDDDGYWKAGAYVQSNPASAPGESTQEYAEVVVHRLTVTHAA